MNVRFSVLIPAYDYPEGVERILSGFGNGISDDIEILIADDSPGDQIGQLVVDFGRRFPEVLHYSKNQPRLGAVSNWNSLLERASGEYILLLHHDEYPLGEEFAQRVLGLLNAATEVDVFVMECMLMSSRGEVVRPHLPVVIRELALRYFPAYLFRRNVIGPASCLIVRRALFPRFDERLRWLVDVDAYFRLRQTTARWRVCSELKIASTLGRKDSITASIKNELKELTAQERNYLINKYPEARAWLLPSAHRFLWAVEGVAWLAMRAFTSLFYLFAYGLHAIKAR